MSFLPDSIVFKIIGTVLSEIILFLLTKLSLFVGFLGFIVVESIFIVFLLYFFFYKIIWLFPKLKRKKQIQKISFKLFLIEIYSHLIKREKRKWFFVFIFANLIIFMYYWTVRNFAFHDLNPPHFINNLVEKIMNFLINLKIIK